MTEHKTGGAAFPTIREINGYSDSQNVICSDGMTLRDYFAGQALTGLFAAWNAKEVPGWQEGVAWRAYSLADAMLAERKKG